MTQPLNFDNYTFRCSSLGKIMGELGQSPNEKWQDCRDELQKLVDLQNKVKEPNKTSLKRAEKIVKLSLKLSELEKFKDDDTPSLPQTCISYLIEIYVSVRNGIKKDIHSKYFEKGIACEDEAIELLGELHDRPYNKCLLPRMRNEFIEGECDIRFIEDHLRIIIDMKNAWNAFTFENRINSEIDPDYEDQGQGYLELYDCDIFILVFGLVNMPQNLVEDECKRILWQYGSNMNESEEYLTAIEEFKKQCTFDHLSLKERFFEFEVKRSRERYSQIVERVKLCRTWLNNYAKKRFNLCNGIVEEPLREVALVESAFEIVHKTKEIVEKLQEIASSIPIPEKIVEIDGVEYTATIELKSDEIVYEPEQNFPEVLDTIEKENPIVVIDAKLNEITEKYEKIISEKPSELELAKIRIGQMTTVDEIRIFRKTDPLFVKYPELDQITRDRKTEIEKPVSTPALVVTPKPKPTPVPTPIAEPVIDETTTKEIERIWELAKSQTTYEDFIANVSKPNAQLIIKNKDFCLELQKFGIQLKNKVK